MNIREGDFIWIKQILLTCVLAAVTILCSSTIVSEYSQNVGGGSWTYGLSDPGNNYYMGYSYYYHGSNAHTSSVRLGDEFKRSAITALGKTAMVNSSSQYKITDVEWWYNSRA